MFYTIYKTTNKVDGKIYIGKHQTENLHDNYFGSGKHLWRAIHKYGIENFDKEILFQFDNEADMNAKEAELVTEEFVKGDDNYNLCPGGKGGWGYVNNSENSKANKIKGGKSHSKEHMKRIASESHESRRKRMETDEKFRLHIASNFGDRFKGLKHTEEAKKKIGKKNSVRQSGSGNSQFGKMWITNGSVSTTILKNDPIPDGWYRGRKIKSI